MSLPRHAEALDEASVMELGLAGARVLITGSSRGIGYSIATAFLEEGADVVLTGRDVKDLRQARSSLAEEFGHLDVDAFAGDLGDPKVRLQLHDRVAARGVDNLVCNVGSGQSVPILQETDEEWHRMLEINLVQAAGMVRDMRGLLAASATRGRGASMTFVGSICGLEALGCPLAYASAKAGLWAYARNLVRPLANDGIRVNQVSPGNVIFPGSTWETRLTQDSVGVQAMLDREVAMRRLGTSKEVAAAVVFLASPRAAFVTGANLVVDGGQTRGL